MNTFNNDLKLNKSEVKATAINKAKSKGWLWQITLLSLLLSALFGIISELMLSHTHLLLALILIIILTAINLCFDIIGTAVTAANIKNLLELKSRNINGIEEGILLIKNADKVSSICSDVMGDICSILCGAAGASIVIIITSINFNTYSFIVSIIINAIIASINVLAKAIGKSYALASSDKIVVNIGKIIHKFYKHKSHK